MRMRPTCGACATALALFACAPPPANEAAAADEARNETAAEPVAGPRPATGNEAATPAPAPPSPPEPVPAPETYSARGQEPGWLLRIGGGRIVYEGNYGEKKIEAPAPAPTETANGRRYRTERLAIDIVYERCNDAMSGHGYAHRVAVTADGERYEGCGGDRRREWDA